MRLPADDTHSAARNPLSAGAMRLLLTNDTEHTQYKDALAQAWLRAFVARAEHAYTCNGWSREDDSVCIEPECCDCGLEAARLLVQAMGEK